MASEAYERKDDSCCEGMSNSAYWLPKTTYYSGEWGARTRKMHRMRFSLDSDGSKGAESAQRQVAVGREKQNQRRTHTNTQADKKNNNNTNNDKDCGGMAHYRYQERASTHRQVSEKQTAKGPRFCSPAGKTAKVLARILSVSPTGLRRQLRVQNRILHLLEFFIKK